MACRVASVPEFAKRHCSWPKRSFSSFATDISRRCGMACRVPRFACDSIAWTTLGWAWPTSSAPNALEKSVYRLPSASVITAPTAVSMKIGFGSTTLKLEDTPRGRRRFASLRSEEHTSELQSHVNLVCRLLLEKK